MSHKDHWGDISQALSPHPVFPDLSRDMFLDAEDKDEGGAASGSGGSEAKVSAGAGSGSCGGVGSAVHVDKGIAGGLPACADWKQHPSGGRAASAPDSDGHAAHTQRS
mgnify:CR=1 FL=1